MKREVRGKVFPRSSGRDSSLERIIYITSIEEGTPVRGKTAMLWLFVRYTRNSRFYVRI